MSQNPFAPLMSWLKQVVTRAKATGSDNPVLWSPKVLSRSREIVTQAVEQCFAQSQTPGGTPWAPKKDGSRATLVKTGRLKAGAIAAAEAMKLINGEGIATDFRDPFYGLFHKFGTRFMPSRDFFGISDSEAREIAEMIGVDYAQFLVDGKPAI